MMTEASAPRPTLLSRHRLLPLALAAAALLLFSRIVHAQGARPTVGEILTPVEVALAAGAFGVLDGDEAVGEAGMELRFAGAAARLFGERVWLEPAVGLTTNADGVLYGYAGFRMPFELGGGWRLVPQWAVGIYERNDGKDLGGAVEFRSGIELALRLGERQTVGLVVYHLSNAGIYRPNPGVESLAAVWSIRPGG